MALAILLNSSEPQFLTYETPRQAGWWIKCGLTCGQAVVLSLRGSLFLFRELKVTRASIYFTGLLWDVL